MNFWINMNYLDRKYRMTSYFEFAFTLSMYLVLDTVMKGNFEAMWSKSKMDSIPIDGNSKI